MLSKLWYGNVYQASMVNIEVSEAFEPRGLVEISKNAPVGVQLFMEHYPKFCVVSDGEKCMVVYGNDYHPVELKHLNF